MGSTGTQLMRFSKKKKKDTDAHSKHSIQTDTISTLLSYQKKKKIYITNYFLSSPHPLLDIINAYTREREGQITWKEKNLHTHPPFSKISSLVQIRSLYCNPKKFKK